MADAIAEAGGVSQLVLTKRYHPATRAFLQAARGLDVRGARACYLHGAFVESEFATGWRLEHGALLDLGPHQLDLLDAAIGPINGIRGTGDARRWFELTCEHENGSVSQATLSGPVAVPHTLARVELFGPALPLVHDTAGSDHEECWPVLRREFATAVRTNAPSSIDAGRGLYLQTLLERAAHHGAFRAHDRFVDRSSTPLFRPGGRPTLVHDRERNATLPVVCAITRTPPTDARPTRARAARRRTPSSWHDCGARESGSPRWPAWQPPPSPAGSPPFPPRPLPRRAPSSPPVRRRRSRTATS
nr:hypothetical protein [Streptomyces geysiriensis]